MEIFSIADDRVHARAMQEEWTWAFWAADASIGGFTSYRLIGGSEAWYAWALARSGQPLLHVTEWDIPRRSDPMVAKAPAMWAEFICEAPFEQWTVGNETYAVELEDPSESLGRGYGTAVPVASDYEWYSLANRPVAIDHGYRQAGVVHGTVELASGRLELTELRAVRTHRWSLDGALPPLRFPRAIAHVGLRAPFRYPDGTTLDLVLTASGWCARR